MDQQTTPSTSACPINLPVQSQSSSVHCPHCGPVTAKRLPDHVDAVHVPWFFQPDKACFTCHQGERTVARLNREHEKCWKIHEDVALRMWVEWTLSALKIARDYWGLDSLEDLLQVILDKRLHPPPESDNPPTPRTVMFLRMWDRLTKRTPQEHYQLHHQCDVLTTSTERIPTCW